MNSNGTLSLRREGNLVSLPNLLPHFQTRQTEFIGSEYRLEDCIPGEAARVMTRRFSHSLLGVEVIHETCYVLSEDRKVSRDEPVIAG
jgi:hypothetical protein